MSTRFTIEGTFNLPDGTVAITGSFDGPRLKPGQHGRAVSPDDVEVQIISAGGLDRDLIKPNMEMVLVKILKGGTLSLKGMELDFE
jgi:hypothetical protein